LNNKLILKSIANAIYPISLSLQYETNMNLSLIRKVKTNTIIAIRQTAQKQSINQQWIASSASLLCNDETTFQRALKIKPSA
jgi:hypothetical protein